MERQLVYLLWSGGWDGTFRFLQLMQHPEVVIQPIYVRYSKRQSSDIEQRQMRKIIHEAVGRFPAKVKKIQYYEKAWIMENCKDEAISAAFAKLRERYLVGWQYEWFALLMKHMDIQAESAVVHQYHGKVEDAIDAEGILEAFSDPVLGERYRVLPSGDSDNAWRVFGNLILPVIKLTKKDEERIARENGWMDIMEMSWFCHKPIHGKPCGLCGPCDDAMNTGMEWRMPASAQRRYRHKKFYGRLRFLLNKIGIRY